MMTAPYMPIAMCRSTGGVPQWYMKMPECVAVNLYTNVLPGPIIRIVTFGATLLAWKSIEWTIVPLLTRVISNVSPTFPRRIGPGT